MGEEGEWKGSEREQKGRMGAGGSVSKKGEKKGREKGQKNTNNT